MSENTIRTKGQGGMTSNNDTQTPVKEKHPESKKVTWSGEAALKMTQIFDAITLLDGTAVHCTENKLQIHRNLAKALCRLIALAELPMTSLGVAVSRVCSVFGRDIAYEEVDGRVLLCVVGKAPRVYELEEVYYELPLPRSITQFVLP